MKKIKFIIMVLTLGLFTSVFNVSAAEEFLLCETSAILTFRIAGYVIFVIKIVVPLIIMGQAMIELSKVVISGEQKDFSATISNFVKRLMAGILIFFIPTLVNFVLTLIDGASENKSSFADCHECLLDPNGTECEEIISDLEDSGKIISAE